MSLSTLTLPWAPDVSWLDLAKQVAMEHGVPLDRMLGRGRHKRTALARHVFWGALRGAGYSYPEIARGYGVDHTTVMAGVKSAAKKLGIA